jgi:hypothetical protein
MSEKEEYWCIYYPDLPCPVQARLKEFTLIDSIEPVKTDDNAGIARAMKTVMTASTFILQCLASFCGSCPHMRRKTYIEATVEAEKMTAVGSTQVAPISREGK